MEIHTRQVQDVLVVLMVGRLDSQTCGQASTELVEIAQSGRKKVLLNVDSLEYISSAGLRAIHVAAKLLQVHGGVLKICHPNPLVKQVMEVTGFKSLLHMYDTESEALAAFSL